jgi:hypothetical protein
MQGQKVVQTPGIPARITKVTDAAYGISLKLPPHWQYLSTFKRVVAVIEAPGVSSWQQELTLVRITKGGRRIYNARSPGAKILGELYAQGVKEVIVVAMFPYVEEEKAAVAEP